MRIGLDLMGGDFAPYEILKGYQKLLQQKPDYEIVMFGILGQVENYAKELGIELTSKNFVACGSMIEMHEHPARAVSSKKDSTIVVASKYLSEGKIDGFASAGNSGAIMVAGFMICGLVDGISRPVLTSIVPRSEGKHGLLLDVGANADCKPELLNEFASLGSTFLKNVRNIQNPRVGLLNIGSEKGKGNILTKETYTLLENNTDINFVGNIESREMFKDNSDLIVCDGFTGNIVVKACQGMFYHLKKEGVNSDFLDGFNFKNYGGTVVLGIKKPLVIGHGITKSDTVPTMCNLTADVAKSN